MADDGAGDAVLKPSNIREGVCKLGRVQLHLVMTITAFSGVGMMRSKAGTSAGTSA